MSTYYDIDKVFFNQSLFTSYTPILVYHNIIPDNTPVTTSDCALTVSQFEKQMRFLSDHRYTCIKLADLFQPSAIKEPLPPKTFVLTFDDGFEDFYTMAYPILHRYKFVATIFVITDFIRKSGFYEADMNGQGMTWEQIRILSAEGFSFGSHTCLHFRLSDLPENQIWHELIASKECLNIGLGQNIQFLAYPYGDSNPAIQRIVKQAGYEAAFGVITVEPGRFNLWRTELKTQDSMLTFNFKLTRWYSYYIKLRGWVRERTIIGRYIRRVKHRHSDALKATLHLG